MRKAIIIFIIYFTQIFLQVVNCNEQFKDTIGLQNLTRNEFHGNTTLSNQTYLLDQSIFDKSHSSFFIEMELDLENQMEDDHQIIFALSQQVALQYNNNTQLYEADFFDKRGFFMRKKYFRLEFETSYLVQENNIYLTIYQNTKETNPLIYKINFGYQDNKSPYKCPFNCFNKKGQGICNQQNGQCQCNTGYFDLDCSKKYSRLDLDRPPQEDQSNSFFSWTLNFFQQRKSAFYYGLTIQQTGYLYLKIKKNDNSFLLNNINNNQDHPIVVEQENPQKEKLFIFYSSNYSDVQSMEVADQYFAREIFILNQTQLLNGEEIYLENISEIKRFLINDQQNQSGDINTFSNTKDYKNQQLKQFQLLFGFRYEGQLDSKKDMREFDISLELKDYGPQGETNYSLLSSNLTILVMSIVLVILIIVLLILVYYLHKRTQMINVAINTINKRKGKKEQEFNNILELIPIFKFTQELKQTLSVDNHENEEPACPVCLCEFEIDEDMRKTYCPHYFHADCLQEWLRKQKNCPHCRNSLTPRTMKEKDGNSGIINRQTEQTQEQISKTPMKNKNYTQQIDEISINMSKLTKKSSSPTKSPDKSPIKTPKKASPPKSPLKNKVADMSQVIYPNKNNKKLQKKRTQSTLPSENYSSHFSLQKIQKLEGTEEPQIEDILQIKSATFIDNFKEAVQQQQDNHIGVTIATEVVTQMGDRTNTNLKNRSSITSGMSSVYESLNQFNNNKKSNKSRYADKLNMSQLFRKSDSIFDNNM